MLSVGGFDLGRALEDDPNFTQSYRTDHPHDPRISSVGIGTAGDVHSEKLHDWLDELLAEQGHNIFRMKGILSLSGEQKRYVFQGVHMMFDSRLDRPWRESERINSMIFIGRDLDRKTLTSGFKACLI